MRPLAALFIFAALVSVPLRTAEPAPAALGPVRFIPPAGWPRGEAGDRNTRVFYAPTGDAAHQATIVVALGRPADGADFDFRARFDDWVSATLVGMELTRQGAPRSGTSRQRLKSLTQQVVAVNGADQKTYARFVAYAWENRIIGFCLTASTEKLLEQYQGDLDRLARSATVEGGPDALAPKRPRTD